MTQPLILNMVILNSGFDQGLKKQKCPVHHREETEIINPYQMEHLEDSLKRETVFLIKLQEMLKICSRRDISL